MNRRHRCPYAFEGLEVWQHARKLVGKIYVQTERFPNEKLYGLTSQLRRATISVASDIAEGPARKNKKNRGHFYYLSFLNRIVADIPVQQFNTSTNQQSS